MSKIVDGGPAFPGGQFEPQNGGSNDREPWNHGMSLRDWIAATINLNPEDYDIDVEFLQTMIGRTINMDDIKEKLQASFDGQAVLRYMLADAMLKARESIQSKEGEDA